MVLRLYSLSSLTTREKRGRLPGEGNVCVASGRIGKIVVQQGEERWYSSHRGTKRTGETFSVARLRGLRV